MEDNGSICATEEDQDDGAGVQAQTSVHTEPLEAEPVGVDQGLSRSILHPV